MKVQIGIALGGGGARGLAHIGVLKILQQKKIPVDFLAGTSMGSVIGAMYAQNPDSTKIFNKFDEFLNGQSYSSLGIKHIPLNKAGSPSFLTHFSHVFAQRIVLNFALSNTGIIKRDRLEKAVSALIDDGDIRDTKIPFRVLATDLNSGKTKVFDKGSIREAVIVSSSIPGYITPTANNGELLTDGGVSIPVPVDHVREMGADIVLGVSAQVKYVTPIKNPNVISIISQAQKINGILLDKYQLDGADVTIHPELDSAHWSEFKRFKEFVMAGENAAKEKMKEIKIAIRNKRNFPRRVIIKLTDRILRNGL